MKLLKKLFKQSFSKMEELLQKINKNLIFM